MSETRTCHIVASVTYFGLLGIHQIVSGAHTARIRVVPLYICRSTSEFAKKLPVCPDSILPPCFRVRIPCSVCCAVRGNDEFGTTRQVQRDSRMAATSKVCAGRLIQSAKS